MGNIIIKIILFSYGFKARIILTQKTTHDTNDLSIKAIMLSCFIIVTNVEKKWLIVLLLLMAIYNAHADPKMFLPGVAMPHNCRVSDASALTASPVFLSVHKAVQSA